MKTILVTGGSGFIGSNFIRYMIDSYPDSTIINLDGLTYAGNPHTLSDIQNYPGYHEIIGTICDSHLVHSIFYQYSIDIVVHFAAESHVDRSITDGSVFIQTNVFGTYQLLDAALKYGIKRFVHVSTDEVYGSTVEGSCVETDVLQPSSTYSVTKAASDLLALSYYKTHQLPVIVTRCTNNFGPYQYPEKLIPFFITNLIDGKKVPVYGTGENIRDWIYVIDHCRALDFLIQKGNPGEIYHIGGGNEQSNIQITRTILDALSYNESMILYVADRPGHDYRYSLDCSKIQSLGFYPVYSFHDALMNTITWYQENEWWWRPLKQ